MSSLFTETPLVEQPYIEKISALDGFRYLTTDSQYQKEIKITDKNIDGCDHIFDDTVYQSRPPQKICIKCGKFFTY